MRQPLTANQKIRVIGSKIAVSYLDPVNGKRLGGATFRIGQQNDPRSLPQTLGLDSYWGAELVGRRVREKVDLLIEEGNIVTVRIDRIIPSPKERARQQDEFMYSVGRCLAVIFLGHRHGSQAAP